MFNPWGSVDIKYWSLIFLGEPKKPVLKKKKKADKHTEK